MYLAIKRQNIILDGVKIMQRDHLAIITFLMVVVALLFGFFIAFPIATNICRLEEKDHKKLEFKEMYTDRLLAASKTTNIEIAKRELLAALTYIGDMRLSDEASASDEHEIVIWYKNGLTGLRCLSGCPEDKEAILEQLLSTNGEAIIPIENVWNLFDETDGNETVRRLADQTIILLDKNDSCA